DGAIAGFELQDVRVSVYDGKHHAVDSKEVAFVAAGKKAFVAAIKEAGPIVLEPIVKVDINTPAASIGDVTGDLSTRRARISGQDMLPGGRAQITATVPLAELQDYLSRLKALTGGEGTYTMDLSHYDPVPARRQQELVAAFKPQEEAD
ncbi:MAG TPA: elongation factor G, partial [Steroidobacteraceae bacterium]|nr:elongation factor G [Steroidobacteraceae bacterium]